MMTSEDWRRVLGGEGRTYMTEADVGTERDRPGPWIILVDSMNVQQARDLGPVLRQFGVTGRFMSGTLAENMGELGRLRNLLKGGGSGGEGQLDKAVPRR